MVNADVDGCGGGAVGGTFFKVGIVKAVNYDLAGLLATIHDMGNGRLAYCFH